MIIGMAGHIDHGKTALVRALTGVDTDRLPEEKRRGITIELGFAPLHLEHNDVVGIVDVPGHEAFVRTMLAGATGIDLALLVVAADEGVMPQTREHLAILSLLGVRGGVIALTKRDLVGDEWLALVIEDCIALVGGSPLEGADIVAVSSTTGHGIDELRAALGRIARRVPPRAADDLFRLPADRAFSVRGTGTVVTGTVWSGTLRCDETVRVFPSGRPARVRGLEHHGRTVDAVATGQRAAVALAGVEVGEVDRGAVLVTGDGWAPTTVLLAEVTLLDFAPRTIGPRTRLTLHLGTVAVRARVAALHPGIRAGARIPARVVLDEPIVARAGDRFVLRTESPSATIGGGVIEDPLPTHRRSRPVPLAESPEARLGRLLDEAGPDGLDPPHLPIRLGISPAEVRRLVGSAAGSIAHIGGCLHPRRTLDRVAETIGKLVEDHHRAHPLEPGVPLELVRSAAGAPPALVDVVIAKAATDGELDVDGTLVRRRGWNPSPTPGERALLDRLAQAIRDAGREPPSVTDLTMSYGDAVPALLRILARSGVVVPVEADRYYSRSVLERTIEELRGVMEVGREYSPAELRGFLGVSRKYLIPLLEYLDRLGITERRGAGRVSGGTSFAAVADGQGDVRS